EQPASVERRSAAAGEAEESTLAEDWFIAFNTVPVERIPPMAAGVRELAVAAISAPLRHGGVPAVGVLAHELGIGKNLGGKDSTQFLDGLPGEFAEIRVDGFGISRWGWIGGRWRSGGPVAGM